MFRIIKYLLEHGSTYTLGYPLDDINIDEHSFTVLAGFITGYLCLLIILNMLSFTIFYVDETTEVKHKKWIYTKYALIYIILNSIITFGILFVFWNILSVPGLFVGGVILVVLHLIKTIQDSTELLGIFNIMGYFKELIRVEAEYDYTIQSYTEKYNKLINL